MYDRIPYLSVGTADECLAGWEQIVERFTGLTETICIECYPGAFVDEIESAVRVALPKVLVLRTDDLFRSSAEINGKYASLLTDDPVFGMMNTAELLDFLDDEKLRDTQRELAKCETSVVIGTSASLVCSEPSTLIYADLARWELQMRQRRNDIF